jgi:hypothetical protein
MVSLKLRAVAGSIFFVLFALFLFPGTMCIASSDTGLAKQAAADPLATIFGTSIKDWTVAGNDSVVVETAGYHALVVGPGGLTIKRVPKISGDAELVIRFRLVPTEQYGGGISVSAGLKNPEDQTPNCLGLSVSAMTGQYLGTIQWSLSALPGQPYGLYGAYNVKRIPKDISTYPPMIRAQVEKDVSSLPSLPERWMNIRYEMRKNDVRVYLDGRMLREVKGDYVNHEGNVRIYAWLGTQIASIRVSPLPPKNLRFETLDISAYLNTSEFMNSSVRKGSLPEGREVTVGNVPFLLPVHERGNDHIDLGRSWARFGALEGGFDGWEGENPRWRGALDIDAGRIRLRIPNAPYSKLYLLAAFEGEPDTTSIVTAQFYRPDAGHPVNFKGRVPLFSVRGTARCLPVTLSNGRRGNLHLVTIPLEPDGVTGFSDMPYLEMELTKETTIYRAFPDPCYYSVHQAGLPSGVHVFAVTLEQPLVEASFQPDNFAHIWTAPEVPSYTVKLVNRGSFPQAARISLETKSLDGLEKTIFKKSFILGREATTTINIPLKLARYGYHDVKFTIDDGTGPRTINRSLAFLHPDTRERGNWEEGKGPIFGFWNWNGGHITPSGIPYFDVMYKAGAESAMSPFVSYPEEEKKWLQEHHFVTHFLAYQLSMIKEHIGVEWDPTKPEEMKAAIIQSLKKSPLLQPSPLNKPELAVFFAEPLLGPVSYISFPEYFGEPEYRMSESEQQQYKRFLDMIVIAASAIKKEWPDAKCLIPWGIPTFPIPFLRYSKEAASLMDGPALDVVLFERLPEMQIDQVSFASCMWQLKQEWLKAGKPWPNLITIEGPSVSPATPGALTQQEEADHFVRAQLILNAYGTTRLLGMPTPFACAGAWGEQHYGGGMCQRLPILSPKIMYVAFATQTRQLNRMNFVKSIPTGSNSVFCLQYKHYKSGKLLHVFWTLRGTRPAVLDVADGKTLELYDQMDNSISLVPREGKVSFTITTSPCYVWGLTDDAHITLGEPDHSDSVPSALKKKLANLGDGRWKISFQQDTDYETSHYEFVRKFVGKMKISSVQIPGVQGKTGLAVHLEKQEKERKVMPFYATLVPEKPIVIPGRPSHLGIWVKAASDWGRVVYCLRDAKGERWISVGKKDDWNVDDIHSWSRFCFDGWRYLRFEMPGHAPYDCFREAGTSFWGYYGEGDTIVDLPLTLEKIIIERRTHVIKVDELLPADPQDVILGDLYAEYAKPENMGSEAIRLSRLRIGATGALELDNPIKELERTGTEKPVAIIKVLPPEHQYDGRRCLVFFSTVEGARGYDIWVAQKSDGTGAILCGENWTGPGNLLTGLSPNKDLYLFVTYTDKNGKKSKPSAPFRINLKDMFPQK